MLLEYFLRLLQPELLQEVELPRVVQMDLEPPLSVMVQVEPVVVLSGEALQVVLEGYSEVRMVLEVSLEEVRRLKADPELVVLEIRLVVFLVQVAEVARSL